MSKTDHKQNIAVPRLRFPEFKGLELWDIKPFKKVFTRITAKNLENNQNVLTISAQQGLVSQLDYFNKSVSARDVSGYYLLHKGDFAYNKSYSQGYPMGAIKPLKYYEKGVVSTLYICFRAKPEYSINFFEQYFDAGMLNKEIEKIAQEGARNHGLLNISVSEFFEKLELLIPELKEQKKIADCLSSIDELITAQAKKIESLQKHKKGLMQQLFPAEGDAAPKIRFKLNNNAPYPDWQKTELKKLAKRITVKNQTGTVTRVLTNSAADGIVDQRDYFDRDIANKGNLVGYYIVENGDYVYNPRISNIAPVGPISKNKIGTGVMSPLYTVFRFKNKNNGFYEQYFKSTHWHNYLHSVSNHGARHDRMNITNDRFMDMPLPEPHQNEQQKIADCLTSLDELIAAETQKLDFFKTHKKGLMQQLFPAMDEVSI